MRLNKIFAVSASIAVITAFSAAQTAEICIKLAAIGNSYTQTDVRRLNEAGEDAPSRLVIDINDFGDSDFYYVTVTPYFRTPDTGGLTGVNIVNTFIRPLDGLRVYTGFTRDDGGFNNDDRKNARTHSIGRTDADGAGNHTDYLNNSVNWWQRGGNISGPAAFGKALFTGAGFSDTEYNPMFSFVVVVPKEIGTYRIQFQNVLSGGEPNTDPTVKTNVLSGTGPSTRQWNLELCDGHIEVVPEPASMIALGSGLVGLLALRRRKK